MSSTDAEMFQETVRAFRKRRIESEWEKLNAPDAERFAGLWQGLRELGATGFSMPESAGGVVLDAPSRFAILRELTRSSATRAER